MTAVSTSCIAMNGPYPPVLPPKPPNIGVAHSVYVTSTKSLQPIKRDAHDESDPQPSKPADMKPSEPPQETRKEVRSTRTSAFAESIEQPVAGIKSKLEPRIEPPGAAYGGRQPRGTNPEIGIISFLCEYPRAGMQSVASKKNLFQSLLPERSLLLGLRQKTPAAIVAKTTNEGRRYSQIVIKGLYEGGYNKSTYEVNVVNGVAKPTAKGRLKSKRLGDEVIRPVKKREPIESLNGDGESLMITSDQMADSININLNHGQKREVRTLQERKGEREERESSPTLILPLHRAAESTFGVDFSNILSRHDEETASPKKAKGASFSTLRMTRSESRPNVRDFAGEGSVSFLGSAFRQRSKSPIKSNLVKDDAAKQYPLKQSPSKNPNRHTHVRKRSSKSPRISPKVPELSVYAHRTNTTRDSVTQHVGLAAPVPLTESEPINQRLWITTDIPKQSTKSRSQHSSGHSSNTKNTSTSKGHSKSPSGVSAGSNENDNLSEVSSAIISDAQSIAIHKPSSDADWSNGILARKPLRPRPAPTGPLPSLPEGHDMQIPTTPRRSESSQRRPSPERSPTKTGQQGPVKYRLTPAEGSPTNKRSPARMNTATMPERAIRKPAALVRIQTSNLDAFPSPPLLSPGTTRRQSIAVAHPEKLLAHTDVGTVSARAERTKKLKAKDLAKGRSQAPTWADESHPPDPKGSDGHRDSLERLIDSYETQQAPPWHGRQLSVLSTSSASTRNNRNSIRSSELSPIIIVADQKPVASTRLLSEQETSSEYTKGFEELPAGVETQTNSIADEAIQHLDSRPASEYSLQAPQPPDKSSRRSMANRSPYRSVVNRAPTPLTHPTLLRKASHRSSQRSSFTERDLEARMVAMEKKNRWLERAFHAVMDASASISSGEDSQARDSGHSYGIGHRFSGSANGGLDLSSADTVDLEGNGDRLHAGMEKALVRQERGRLRSLSTSSEPF